MLKAANFEALLTAQDDNKVIIAHVLDDSNLHTDGPDAILAMRILVTSVGAFVLWLGLFVNNLKSYIPANDF